MHLTLCPFCFARLNAGIRMAASSPIMLITTSNSIKVNPGEGAKHPF